MPTNLILNPTNYADPSLTNGKVYNTAIYGCNYPLTAITFNVTATLSSKYITSSAGGFLEMLGCDIQNNNVPVYKWIISENGDILEVDYIIQELSKLI